MIHSPFAGVRSSMLLPTGILALLPPGGRDGWSAADRFDERAGIVEFDGGLRMAEPQHRAPARCCLAVAAAYGHDPLLALSIAAKLAAFALLAGMTGFAGSRRACRTGCSRNQKGVLTDDEYGRHEINIGCRQRSR